MANLISMYFGGMMGWLFPKFPIEPNNARRMERVSM
jgi:hypothetical protein